MDLKGKLRDYRKTVVSLVVLLTAGGVIFGGFSTSKGVAPEIDMEKVPEEFDHVHKHLDSELESDLKEESEDEPDKKSSDLGTK